jgi:hypothetical protein
VPTSASGVPSAAPRAGRGRGAHNRGRRAARLRSAGAGRSAAPRGGGGGRSAPKVGLARGVPTSVGVPRLGRGGGGVPSTGAWGRSACDCGRSAERHLLGRAGAGVPTTWAGAGPPRGSGGGGVPTTGVSGQVCLRVRAECPSAAPRVGRGAGCLEPGSSGQSARGAGGVPTSLSGVPSAAPEGGGAECPQLESAGGVPTIASGVPTSVEGCRERIKESVNNAVQLVSSKKVKSTLKSHDLTEETQAVSLKHS